MELSIQEVDKIAKLARLSFSDVEKQKLKSELSSILNYVAQLKEVAGDSDIDDIYEGVNLMRNDVAEVSISPEELLAQVPSREGNFIKVKSILE